MVNGPRFRIHDCSIATHTSIHVFLFTKSFLRLTSLRASLFKRCLFMFPFSLYRLLTLQTNSTTKTLSPLRNIYLTACWKTKNSHLFIPFDFMDFQLYGLVSPLRNTKNSYFFILTSLFLLLYSYFFILTSLFFLKVKGKWFTVHDSSVATHSSFHIPPL
jgi:hypothetical protein